MPQNPPPVNWQGGELPPLQHILQTTTYTVSVQYDADTEALQMVTRPGPKEAG